ncbi:MAG: beta-lactamase family protein [Kordiimonadaceae bacterium]|nr:beta-lactamase family protein [Kordiimonadaceae bacterium]
MLKSVKIILAVIFTLFLFGCSSPLDKAEEKAEQMFNEVAALPYIPGINVAVADNNGVIWAEGFGYANLEDKTPMTVATKMRIGSVAKVITTAALMQEVERGEIDLDADIRAYVPDWPGTHAKITIRQLANHTAGVRHYQGDEFASNVPYDSTLDALNIFKNDPLLFAPGSQYSYSTYGWTLISAAMEAAEGRDFKSIIRDEVLNPLNMTETTFDDATPIIANRQGSYDYVGGKLVNSPAVNSSYKYAGGGFLATPTDVVKFAMAHATPGFLRAESLSEMFSRGDVSPHGIGWVVGFDRYRAAFTANPEQAADVIAMMDRHPHTVMHSGGSTGGLTMMILCLDHNRAVALTKNVGNAPPAGEDQANHFLLALKTLDIFHTEMDEK